VHAAGVVEDGLLANTTDVGVERVLAAKVAGAWHLHELTLDDPIEFFVLYGSAAALFGVAGQSAYAAANAYLSGLAELRRAQGQPGLCLQWGPWEAGMAAGHAESWVRHGIAPIKLADGVDLALHAIGSGSSWPAAPLLLRAAAVQHGVAGRPIAALPQDVTAGAAKQADLAFRDTLLALPPPRRSRALIRYLQSVVGEMMGLPASDPPDPRMGVTELGMDSLMAVEMRDRLQHVFGRPLSAAVVLEHPTLEALGRFLLSEAAVAHDRTPPPEANDELASLAADQLTEFLSNELDQEVTP
jgi:hypothetical protein